jgi:hypothetical protein
MTQRRYWLFQVPAARYDLSTELVRLDDGEEAEWPGARYPDEMQPGDGVVLYLQ